jgi:hypothetical protein
MGSGVRLLWFLPRMRICGQIAKAAEALDALSRAGACCIDQTSAPPTSYRNAAQAERLESLRKRPVHPRVDLFFADETND